MPTEYKFRGAALDREDEPRLARALDRVRHAMMGRDYLTLKEISEIAGVALDSSTSRLMRYLRKPEHGGFTIEKRLRAGRDGQPIPGCWEYKLSPPLAADQEGQYELPFTG